MQNPSKYTVAKRRWRRRPSVNAAWLIPGRLLTYNVALTSVQRQSRRCIDVYDTYKRHVPAGFRCRRDVLMLRRRCMFTTLPRTNDIVPDLSPGMRWPIWDYSWLFNPFSLVARQLFTLKLDWKRQWGVSLLNCLTMFRMECRGGLEVAIFPDGSLKLLQQ